MFVGQKKSLFFSIIFEEVFYLGSVSLQPGGVEPDGLHCLGYVPLTARQRMVQEELLHLPGSLLAQQVCRAGLDQPGQEEAGAVSLTEQHELVLEELPGQVSPQPSENVRITTSETGASALLLLGGNAADEVDAVLSPHLVTQRHLQGLGDQNFVGE